MDKALKIAQIAAIIGGLIFGGMWLKNFFASEIPVGVAVLATESDAVADVSKTEIVILKPISVYAPEAKRKTRLPDLIINDMDKHVIASSTVKSDTHPQTVTTVIDSVTGKSTTFVVREPLPWLALSRNGHVAAYYGLSGSNPAVMVQASQEFLKIKAVAISGIIQATQVIHSGGYGGDVPIDTFGGIGFKYGW